MMRYIITGGNGFIGTNLILNLIKNKKNTILNLDKLTYASNKQLNDKFKNYKNYNFIKVDISNYKEIEKIIFKFKPNVIINLAAESHVDKSITSSKLFIKSNIIGVHSLLEGAKNYYFKLLKSNKGKFNFKFYHISTDEVFGDLKKNEKVFNENSNFKPNSPYSSSKASAEMLVKAWASTYGLPIVISNTSNNYGPYQNEEKLIPLTISRILKNENIPIYGNGKQIRDWIYVEDHVEAIIKIATKGKIGQTYCVGSRNEKTNLEVVKKLCKICEFYNFEKKKKIKNYTDLIKFVEDRPGHDLRYGISNNKIINKLKWRPNTSFDKGLSLTVDWYIKNQSIFKKKYTRQGILIK